jgi:cation transport ATPase
MDTKHYNFNILGITCNNCIAKITKFFEEQLSATKIVFNYKNNNVEFDTNSTVNVKQLNQLLTTIGNYKISADNATAAPIPGNPQLNRPQDNEQETASYKPIYIIFAYLIVTSILLKLKGYTVETALASFMAGFFLIFSFFKCWI